MAVAYPILDMKEHTFRSLDGLRGLLALTVALMHFPALIYFPGLGRLHAATLAVDFFFLLSGFVIAHNLRDGLAHARSFAAFVQRRFLRLYPLHVTTLAILVVTKFVSLLSLLVSQSSKASPFSAFDYSGAAILLNLSFLQAFAAGTWNFPSWSIAVEFWTYIAYGLLVYIVPKRPGLLAAAMSASLLLQWTTFGTLAVAQPLLRCVSAFSLGAMLYSWRRPLSAPQLAYSVIEATTAAAALAFAVTYYDSAAAILAPLAFAPLLYVVAIENGLLSSFLKLAPLQRLGELSYAIYMVHVPVIIILNHWLSLTHKGISGAIGSRCAFGYAPPPGTTATDCHASDYIVLLLVCSVYLTLIIAVAAFAARRAEPPLREFLHRIFRPLLSNASEIRR